MSFIGQLLGKDSDYSSEYKRFKKGMEHNPGDLGLKAQFIKFCLLNRFTKHDISSDHVAEALKLFEAIANADTFDLQCHYLVGKFYQEEKDPRKAYRTYLHAIKRFNQLAIKDPAVRAENSELAYSVALNLMTLQSNPIDPEVEVCFKILRKSFLLHLKRIEFENEMAKPAPDKARVKQLAEEIRRLRAEEETTAPAKAQTAENPSAASASSPGFAQATPGGPQAGSTPSTSSGQAGLPQAGSRSAQGAGGQAGQASPTPRGPAPSAAAEPSPAPSAAAFKPKEPKGIFSKLFTELSPASLGLSPSSTAPSQKPAGGEGKDSFKLPLPSPEASAPGFAFLVFHDDQWEGPYTTAQLRSLGFLRHGTWVCRDGSQQVLQAYEVPDLQPLFQFQR